ncbi:MAG: electron transfer flavoprotein subunit alpha/FixB family protein [Clostridiales Family XIII bacterium]|jgi:electron transfer flavoprotein alpha subunit|nr:electron transfer flavoprotein subunit alpha/FixB family protein [Clostridiales Family XIII bacterium]
MHKTLVYIDEYTCSNSQIAAFVDAASQIYPEADDEIYAVTLGKLATTQTIRRYVDAWIQIDCNYNMNHAENYDILTIVDFLEKIQQMYQFDCILTAAEGFGRMVAPALAMRLQAGLIAEVSGITRTDAGMPTFVRPAYGGKLFACIESKSTPVMASIDLNAFGGENMDGHIDINLRHRAGREAYLKLTSFRESGVKLLRKEVRELPYDIRDAEILVSGGGGTSKYFKKLYRLADALNGKVAASRRIVDARIVGREIQVGQSGKTVSPKLYIALGIYGSLQHIEGVNDADYIISVNTDKDAPICSMADIVVEGDASEFIDLLLARIQQ